MPDRRVPISILDLAVVGRDQTERDALEATVTAAKLAERTGYERVWYAEHHNIRNIASSATSVLIAHVANHTETIRLGAGGIMLPNHAPLVVAEQFGTLAILHPGRIDLGLGRAPGADQVTMRALHRDPSAADRFVEDVLELQGYLTGESRVRGVQAVPGAGTNVPLYILGSSLYGARVAAALGLPYAFASHFAPALLDAAVATYRRQFTPSTQLDRPYVMVGVNVIAADADDDAQDQFVRVARSRVGLVLGRGRRFSDEEADRILRSPQGQPVLQMLRCSAVGDPPAVRTYLDEFVRRTEPDELVVVHAGPTLDARLRSIELLAELWDGGVPAARSDGAAATS